MPNQPGSAPSKRVSAKRPALGAAVTFSGVLERHYQGNARVWLVAACHPTRGFYIGTRTVYEGTYKSGYYGEDTRPPYLCNPRGIHHALVVTHPRRAPVRVPFERLDLAALVAPTDAEEK